MWHFGIFFFVDDGGLSRRVQKFRADYADLRSQFEKIRGEVRVYASHAVRVFNIRCQ